MAQAFGSPSLLIQRSADAPVTGLAYATATGFGIPALLVEDGGAGQYDAGIAERLLAGIENVLRSLEVLPGGVRNMPPSRRFAKFTWIRTTEAGFFRHEAKVGDELAAGQRLGRLVDFFGATIEEVDQPPQRPAGCCSWW
jgi:predicted deacylase